MSRAMIPDAPPSPDFPLIRQHLANVPDPRSGGVLHVIGDVLLAALCATLSGADSFTAMAEFTASKLDWLRLYAPFKNGAPSHDTFRYVLTLLKPDALHQQIQAILGHLGDTPTPPGNQISIDGKSLRGTASPSSSINALHLLRAYANDPGIAILYQPCELKSNEITALPKLLNALELEGSIVTIDAMGCQTHIAQQIHDQGGNYVLGLKSNQATSYKAVGQHATGLLECLQDLNPNRYRPHQRQLQDIFDELALTGTVSQFTPAQQLERRDRAAKCITEFETFRTEQLSHGRYELREIFVGQDLSWWPKSWKWAGLQSVIIVIRTNHRSGGKKASSNPTQEVCYYLSNAKLSAEVFAAALQRHWEIENSCHHVLDITYREDHCQVRDRQAAQNLSMLRDLSTHTLKTHPSKGTISAKRQRAGWSDTFRSQLMSHILHA